MSKRESEPLSQTLFSEPIQEHKKEREEEVSGREPSDALYPVDDAIYRSTPLPSRRLLPCRRHPHLHLPRGQRDVGRSEILVETARKGTPFISAHLSLSPLFTYHAALSPYTPISSITAFVGMGW